MLLGLRTVIYPAADLARAKAWYAAVLGADPYFDQPFYVGFDVGGYELGLDHDAEAAAAGPRTNWGVEDADAALAELVGRGAQPHSPMTDVGERIRSRPASGLGQAERVDLDAGRQCSTRPGTSWGSSRTRISSAETASEWRCRRRPANFRRAG